MTDSRTKEQLAAALTAALRPEESIDRLSLLLLRSMLAERYPDAAELSLDWGTEDGGLMIECLYDRAGQVIEDFDEDDDAYLESPWALASNVQSLTHTADLLDGPKNGPFRMKIS